MTINGFVLKKDIVVFADDTRQEQWRVYAPREHGSTVEQCNSFQGAWVSIVHRLWNASKSGVVA